MSLLLEDEYGDDVELDTLDAGALAEFSVLDGDSNLQTPRLQSNGKPFRERPDPGQEQGAVITVGPYTGGFVINKENGKRLLKWLTEWIGGAA